MKQEARIVSQPVVASADAVYAFASRMENLPHWAAGLGTGVGQENGHWFVDTPGGRVAIAMAPRNTFGVLDHDVTMPNGVTTHNAMRVTPVGDDSLLTFTVLRPPGATDPQFDGDCAHVAKDLATLGSLVEARSRG